VLAWMSPIVAGLVLAAPIALFTARERGQVIATLLSTPEQRDPPALLASAAALRAKLKTSVRSANPFSKPSD